MEESLATLCKNLSNKKTIDLCNGLARSDRASSPLRKTTPEMKSTDLDSLSARTRLIILLVLLEYCPNWALKATAMDLQTLANRTGVPLRKLRYVLDHRLLPGMRIKHAFEFVGQPRSFAEHEGFGIA